MSDAYLRPGLTPPTDVELYQSAAEAEGGVETPIAVSTQAVGVAAVTYQVSYTRAFAAQAVASPTVARQVDAARAFSASATGTAAVTVEFQPGAGTLHSVSAAAVATGVASVTATVVSAPPPAPAPAPPPAPAPTPDDSDYLGALGRLYPPQPARSFDVSVAVEARGVATVDVRRLEPFVAEVETVTWPTPDEEELLLMGAF